MSVHIYRALRAQLLEIIEQLQAAGNLPEGLATEAVEVSPPRETAHGDLATNAAMVLANQAKMNPRQIVELLLPHIQKLPEVVQAEIAGPGFINLRFSPSFWQRIIPEIILLGTEYGTSHVGNGHKVSIEYVSANPTGPMHIGHARGAVYGDVLASLLKKAGYEVTKEYYINDAGAQIDKLADSLHLRYRQALGEPITEIPEGLYPGEYLIAPAKSFAEIHGDRFLNAPREEWLPVMRLYAVQQMLELIKQDLAGLGIHHDVFTSEQELTERGVVEEAIARLDAQGLIYQGVLEAPKGKAPEDWEPRPQTLFKSTDCGDDIDRAIRKSDGSWTYFAPDIAYHYDKFLRGHRRLINVLGADHGGYAKRIKAAVTALSGGQAVLEVKLCQLVKFMRKGMPAKMSKRSGSFVTVQDVVEEVGKDVLRFIMLTRKNDAPLDFDLEKVTEHSKDNPVFYVQYAHARCHSLLRLAQTESPEALDLAEKAPAEIITLLTHPAEIELIKTLALWPRMVEKRGGGV